MAQLDGFVTHGHVPILLINLFNIAALSKVPLNGTTRVFKRKSFDFVYIEELRIWRFLSSHRNVFVGREENQYFKYKNAFMI